MHRAVNTAAQNVTVVSYDQNASDHCECIYNSNDQSDPGYCCTFHFACTVQIVSLQKNIDIYI